jgi:molybdopterin molybdotransferase
MTAELGASPLTGGTRDLSVDEARRAIAAALANALATSGGLPTETLPLAQALGRVLATDVISPIDVPAHDNSAMDGYAFDGAALASGTALQLRCAGHLLAGKPFDGSIGAGECLRIMTGAVLPAGLDTVVPIELCRVQDASAAGGETVHIAPTTVKRGDHRRPRGEDLAQGQPALPGGRVLRPADLGLLASLGFTSVTVRRALRVALFSTGDEIVAPGAALPAGGIYDSNRASLAAALARMGAQVLDLGLVRDDPAALEATLRHAMTHADAVLTSGGVSAGDADHTRAVLARMGQVGFWKVAMRPGRPFAFGPLLDGPDAAVPAAWLFALPGNPVAALITFYVLARDGLLQLAGASPQALPLLKARSAVALRKRPGRTEYQRATLEQVEEGAWRVQPFANQGSGILRSMSQGHALIVLHHDQGAVAAGEWVDVWPFDGLV